MLKKAALAIVVCGNMDKALQGPAQGFWVQDCSAATENILLAANALGLGAVWTGLYPDENRSAEVAKVLKLPQAFIPLCTIVIGHPAEQPQPQYHLSKTPIFHQNHSKFWLIFGSLGLHFWLKGLLLPYFSLLP